MRLSHSNGEIHELRHKFKSSEFHAILFFPLNEMHSFSFRKANLSEIKAKMKKELAHETWLTLWEDVCNWKSRSFRRTTNKNPARRGRKKTEFKWYETSHWVKGVKWAALRCYIHKNDVPCFYLDTPFIACCGIKQQNTIKISSKYQFHRPSNRRPISQLNSY